MLTTALMYVAIVWVAISWAKQIVPVKLHKLLCMKCLSFWVTLFATFNPFTAAIAALMGAVVDMYFNSQKIEL